jgi:transcriptional regulator with XRE-family HTH domain
MAMSQPYEQMRALRARSGLSMRAFAARLGAPLDTRYAYYEEKRFTGPLPIDAARRIAAALQPFGVDPAEVMTLAGLLADEAEAGAPLADPAVQYVRLDVALPNADALTRMFETMLDGEVPPGRRDALARNLAQRLPAALQRASGSPPVPVRGASSAGDADPPPPATRRRPRRPGLRI